MLRADDLAGRETLAPDARTLNEYQARLYLAERALAEGPGWNDPGGEN